MLIFKNPRSFQIPVGPLFYFHLLSQHLHEPGERFRINKILHFHGHQFFCRVSKKMIRGRTGIRIIEIHVDGEDDVGQIFCQQTVLGLTFLKLFFDLLFIGDILGLCENIQLLSDGHQCGGHISPVNVAVSVTKPQLKIRHGAFFKKFPNQCVAFGHIHPEIDFRRGASDEFFAAVSQKITVNLVDFNIAAILQAGYADPDRTIFERQRVFFFRAAKRLLPVFMSGRLWGRAADRRFVFLRHPAGILRNLPL
ncbi:MAG: hypothetical protein BWX55_00409 [Deltaproteobacteria bacterium ADurb.Bin022]|nr:MAG: hypothetical protein BWX55_00409 [Deltaproteobacteria bacterium ADurb.Bin022]